MTEYSQLTVREYISLGDFWDVPGGLRHHSDCRWPNNSGILLWHMHYILQCKYYVIAIKQSMRDTLGGFFGCCAKLTSEEHIYVHTSLKRHWLTWKSNVCDKYLLFFDISVDISYSLETIIGSLSEMLCVHVCSGHTSHCVIGLLIKIKVDYNQDIDA